MNCVAHMCNLDLVSSKTKPHAYGEVSNEAEHSRATYVINVGVQIQWIAIRSFIRQAPSMACLALFTARHRRVQPVATCTSRSGIGNVLNSRTVSQLKMR